MPEHCTCGTKLVDDARFCHRCGRPTLETPAETEAEELRLDTAPPAPTAAQVLAQIPVSFGNPIALRIAFFLAMVTMLVQNIPFLNLLFILWWLGAGWAGVIWYRRLTGSLLSVRAGARLGSITGVLTSAAISIEFALANQQIFEQLAKQDAKVTQLVNDPMMRGAVSLIVMIFIFAFVVGVCAAGGALGARFSSRDSA